jgi:hypothetical protein
VLPTTIGSPLAAAVVSGGAVVSAPAVVVLCGAAVVIVADVVSVPLPPQADTTNASATAA